MEYKDVKEWLDNQVEDINRKFEHQYCGNHIRAFSPDDYVLVAEGIEVVADIMGIELTEVFEEESDYPYRYSFIYRDIKFIQYEKERLNIHV